VSAALKRNNDAYVKAGGPYADLIRELVESGEFDHPAHVVLEGLALLEEHEMTKKALDKKLRDAIQVGLDEADRGEVIPAEQVMAELRTRYGSANKE
jgi:antitoxin ParD1/3/4